MIKGEETGRLDDAKQAGEYEVTPASRLQVVHRSV
jgi:hypothetical protein